MNPSDMVHEEDCRCRVCAPYEAEKARWLERLGEDCPTHESPRRLRMRAEWNEQMEQDS